MVHNFSFLSNAFQSTFTLIISLASENDSLVQSTGNFLLNFADNKLRQWLGCDYTVNK